MKRRDLIDRIYHLDVTNGDDVEKSDLISLLFEQEHEAEKKLLGDIARVRRPAVGGKVIPFPKHSA